MNNTNITEMSIPGAYRIRTDHFPDRRGRFYEAWRISDLVQQTGHQFEIRQVNYSVSKKNTVRGIHEPHCRPGRRSW